MSRFMHESVLPASTLGSSQYCSCHQICSTSGALTSVHSPYKTWLWWSCSLQSQSHDSPAQCSCNISLHSVPVPVATSSSFHCPEAGEHFITLICQEEETLPEKDRQRLSPGTNKVQHTNLVNGIAKRRDARGDHSGEDYQGAMTGLAWLIST